MFDHIDTLEKLNNHITLKEKLANAHKSVNKILPFVARISVTLYDPKTRVLKTFIHSSDDNTELKNYQVLLDEAPSLKNILEKGHP